MSFITAHQVLKGAGLGNAALLAGGFVKQLYSYEIIKLINYKRPPKTSSSSFNRRDPSLGIIKDVQKLQQNCKHTDRKTKLTKQNN